MKRKNLFCLWKRLLPFALWALSLMTFAQNITVKGTVTDELGEPLIGVTVQIQGTGIGTTTGADGDYSLANVPRNGKLEISYVGMKTQIIDVNGRTTINITLQEDSEILDESSGGGVRHATPPRDHRFGGQRNLRRLQSGTYSRRQRPPARQSGRVDDQLRFGRRYLLFSHPFARDYHPAERFRSPYRY